MHNKVNKYYLFTLLMFSLLSVASQAQYVYESQIGEPGAGDGQFDDPNGVAVDMDGNIYVVDSDNSRIQKFSETGNFEWTVGGFGAGNSQFNLPQDMAVDSNGNLFVVDQGNHRIQKFDSDGNFIVSFGNQGNGDGQFQEAIGIAIDANDNVYVVDKAQHRVQKFNNSGLYSDQFGTFGNSNGQFNGPNDIAVNKNGDLVVCDAGNGRIQIFDEDGIYKSQFGTFGVGDGQLNNPIGLMTDGGGVIFVVDANNHRVQAFNPDGNFREKFGVLGAGIGEFNFPTFISFGNGNKIYVADNNNHRILVFAGAIPLSVSFLSLNAKRVSNKLILSWQTTDEENNLGFEIQKSSDLKNWENIGFVEAAIQSDLIKNYSFEDKNPEHTTSYYRLKQLDFDQSFMYSKIVSVRSNDESLNIRLYPNPASTRLYMEGLFSSTKHKINVYNSTGKHLLEEQMLLPGYLNVDHFEKGVYLIHIQLENKNIIKKVIIK